MSGLVSGLGINLPVIIAQLVNFTVLLVLLYLFAYKPILKKLDERSRRIKESMEQAEDIKVQMAKTQEEVKKQIETASRESQERVNQALKVGEDLKLKAREDAKKEAETLIERARTEIQQERDEAIHEVRKEFADLTILAAEKVIERSLDKKAHQDLIEKVLEESTKAKNE